MESVTPTEYIKDETMELVNQQMLKGARHHSIIGGISIARRQLGSQGVVPWNHYRVGGQILSWIILATC